MLVHAGIDYVVPWHEQSSSGGDDLVSEQRRMKDFEVILEVQAEKQCNLIFMGGYSKPPVIDVVFGSPLDQVLRESPVPVLICR